MSRPKSWVDSGSSASADQDGDEQLRIEDVNAHGGVDFVGRCAERLGSAGFSSKPRTRHLRVGFDDAKAPRGFRGINFDGGHGNVGARINVLLEHLAIIHFVDVIARENDGVGGALAADGVDILVDGVRGAQIPTGGDAHLRRQNFDEVAESHQRRPALTNMAVQAERLVLRENEDAPQVAIDAIRQRDVDDAVNAAERHRRVWRGRGSAATAAPPGRRPEGCRWCRPLKRSRPPLESKLPHFTPAP